MARRTSAKRNPQTPPRVSRHAVTGALGEAALLPRRTYAPPSGILPWTLRLCASLALGAITLLTAQALLTEVIQSTPGTGLWSSAPFYFFALGILSLPVLLWGFPNAMLLLYVFAHEITHVIFVYLCGGKVHGNIRVTLQGGHVVTNKSNFLISLSPYFVPFYTVIVGLSFAMANLLIDTSRPLTFSIFEFTIHLRLVYFLYAAIGLTWSKHIYYTIVMILKDQPDLRMNGILLSLVIIGFVNLLIVVGLIVAASPIYLEQYILTWIETFKSFKSELIFRLAHTFW